MSQSPWQQAQEAEDQHYIEYGPYTDINGDKLIKCDKCFNPYHVECLQEDIPVGRKDLPSGLTNSSGA